MNNVRDFGAAGDGVTKDTAAIQKAINAGGIVHFPPGTYLSGTIYLCSNGGLSLEPGAVLLASCAPDDYNADDFCPQNQVFAQEKVSGKHFIVAVEQENIIICGGGRIDGNRRGIFGSEELNPNYNRCAFNHPVWRPGQMIYFCECGNVTIKNIELYDAPYWTCFLHGCKDIIIHGVKIWADRRTPNADGIDLDCCCRATVSDCIIDCGDDCITLRANVKPLKKERVCELVTVTNCVLRSPACAIRIGVGNGTIRNCSFSNIIIHDSNDGICLCPLYSTGYVNIEDISFDNFNIESRITFLITSSWIGKFNEPEAKPVKNIIFNRIRAKSRRGSLIIGHQGGMMSGLRFSDVEIELADLDVAQLPDEASVEDHWHARNASSVLYIAYQKEMELDRIKVRRGCHAKHIAEDVTVIESSDIRMTECRMSVKCDA